MKPKILSVWCLGIILFAAASVFAAFGNIQALPGAEGSHIAQIRALGDTAWLDLGAPAADPDWGAARGRSWTYRMTYAPAKRAALFCATGQHGYVKPDGHYMDDLFAYDINAHEWICLYPGAGTPSSSDPLDLHLDSNGFEINDLGEDVPVSYLSHCYANTTYNPDLDLYQIFWTQCPWWCNALPQRVSWLPVDTCDYGGVGPVVANVKYPLFFDVNTGIWDRRFVSGTGPENGRHEGVMEYIPTIGKTFMKYKSGAVWLYDYAANTWTRVTYTGDNLRASSDYDYLGCYDSKRDRVYVGKGGEMWYYDIQANACTKLSAADQPDLKATNSATFSYDSANDIILAGVKNDNANNMDMYVYSADANAWTRLGLLPPNTIPYQHYATVHSFYDPVLNAHFFYLAFDSGNNGATMMVYRYKKAGSAVNAPLRTLNTSLEMTALPNPFNGAVVISWANDACKGGIQTTKARNSWNAAPATQLAIYDTHGRMVHRVENVNTGRYTWDASGLPAGIYLVKASFGKQTLVRKILLQK